MENSREIRPSRNVESEYTLYKLIIAKGGGGGDGLFHEVYR